MGELRDRMIQNMTTRGYSEKTIRLYTGCVDIFTRHFMRSPLEVKSGEIEEFFHGMRLAKKSDSTIRIYLEALRFFFSLNGRASVMPKLRLRRAPRVLPVILNQSELQALFEATSSLQMKTVFSILYSSGLRLGEVVQLDVSDIDFERRCIWVRNGKNSRDRISILSAESSRLLRDYFQIYRPQTALFCYRNDASHRISADSIQKALKVSARKAGIIKNVHVHTLRHCFATHLVENGTSIFHVMALLGHSNIQTTMRYLHVQMKDFSTITSPLDVMIESSSCLQERRGAPDLFSA